MSGHEVHVGGPTTGHDAVRGHAPWWRSSLLRLASLWQVIAKFGIVGLIALVVDVGLFNLLRFAGGEGPLYGKPLTAKVISVVVATTVSYLLNRNWTFSDRQRSGFTREYVMFFIVNGIAMGIALTCLWFSHYILGLTSPVADNISANVVGLVLGTLFRFWAYHRFVFPEDQPDTSQTQSELAGSKA